MRFQKKLSLLLMTLFITFYSNAQEKPTSSAESVSGKINGANITIKYGSPSVRGREIWGGLVAFNQVWRAGANDATTFETDKDLTIQGSKLPAGKYSFFVIPSATECVLIFNKDAKQWGSYKYKESNDQIRVSVKQKASDSSIEKLIYSINKKDIVLSWEKWNIAFNVE